jgi:hypothetical protein
MQNRSVAALTTAIGFGVFVLLGKRVLNAATIGHPEWIAAVTIGYPLIYIALWFSRATRASSSGIPSEQHWRSVIVILALYGLVLGLPLAEGLDPTPLTPTQLAVLSYLGFVALSVYLVFTEVITLLASSDRDVFERSLWQIQVISFTGSIVLLIVGTFPIRIAHSLFAWLTGVGIGLFMMLPHLLQSLHLLPTTLARSRNQNSLGTSGDRAEDEQTQPPRITLAWIIAVTLSTTTLLLLGFIFAVIAAPDSWIVTEATNLVTDSTQAAGQEPNPGSTGSASSPLQNVLELVVAAVGAIGGLAVSSALAAIYWGQNTILGDQTEIQQQQSQIMKQSHVPFITAHERGVDLHEQKPVSIDESSGKLKFENEGGSYASVVLQNHSSEAADQVQLACLLDYPDYISLDVPRKSGVCELEVTEMATKTPRGQGALLTQTQEVTLLTGTPEFTKAFPDGKTSFCQFIPTLRKLFTEDLATCPSNSETTDTKQGDRAESDAAEAGGGDESYVRFGFVVIYSNAVDERFKVPLADAYSVPVGAFKPEEDITLDALETKDNGYDIEQLIKDLDWEIPEDAFVSRSE